MIIISLCLIIGKTLQSLTDINDNIRVLDLTINFEVLKVDIYLEAVIQIHDCINERSNSTIKIVNPEIQSKKLKELMTHLQNVQEHISTILNNKHSFRIFKTIEERFNIYSLGNDWNFSSRTVDILEETRRLSYIIQNAIDSHNETSD